MNKLTLLAFIHFYYFMLLYDAVLFIYLFIYDVYLSLLVSFVVKKHIPTQLSTCDIPCPLFML